MTKDSSLFPISLDAIASLTPEKSSNTPKIPIGNSFNILTNELPSTKPRINFPAARYKREAPLRPLNLYCPAKLPTPWHTGIALNRHPTKFITPTLMKTEDALTPFLGNKFEDNLQTVIAEFRTESGICGIAAHKNLIFQPCHDIFTMWILDGPNLRLFTVDGSLAKQRTNPSKNTVSADGILDKTNAWVLELLLLDSNSMHEFVLPLLLLLLLRSGVPEPEVKMTKSKHDKARMRPSRPSQGHAPVDFPAVK